MSAPIVITVPTKYVPINLAPAGITIKTESLPDEGEDSSSSSMEEFLVRGKKRRLDHLTWEEKLQRKKLKNRVAAQTSRDRKKAKMEDMEKTIQEQSDQISELQSKCDSLAQEKDAIYGKYLDLEGRFEELKRRLDEQQQQQQQQQQQYQAHYAHLQQQQHQQQQQSYQQYYNQQQQQHQQQQQQLTQYIHPTQQQALQQQQQQQQREHQIQQQQHHYHHHQKQQQKQQSQLVHHKSMWAINPLYASSGVISDGLSGGSGGGGGGGSGLDGRGDADEEASSTSYRTRSLPSWGKNKQRPLSNADDLEELYAKVNFSKKRRNRMRNDEAAIIALCRSRSQNLASLPMSDQDAVVVYDERTAL